MFELQLTLQYDELNHYNFLACDKSLWSDVEANPYLILVWKSQSHHRIDPEDIV